MSVRITTNSLSSIRYSSQDLQRSNEGFKISKNTSSRTPLLSFSRTPSHKSRQNRRVGVNRLSKPKGNYMRSSQPSLPTWNSSTPQHPQNNQLSLFKRRKRKSSNASLIKTPNYMDKNKMRFINLSNVNKNNKINCLENKSHLPSISTKPSTLHVESGQNSPVRVKLVRQHIDLARTRGNSLIKNRREEKKMMKKKRTKYFKGPLKTELQDKYFEGSISQEAGIFEDALERVYDFLNRDPERPGQELLLRKECPDFNDNYDLSKPLLVLDMDETLLHTEFKSKRSGYDVSITSPDGETYYVKYIA